MGLKHHTSKRQGYEFESWVRTNRLIRIIVNMHNYDVGAYLKNRH